jgi:manganese/zinc/iron transport system ATP- binding protein
MAPALEFHDVSVAYDERPVLYGVDACIPSGALVGLMGPNGAGKSTLLKAAMGLLPLRSGWVTCFGEAFHRVRRRVGYVPQRESVDWDFPVTVRDVVMMGRYGSLGLLRRPKAGDRVAVADALERVQLSDYADRQIGNLSGGQQQRVFLARALAQESDLYLMDEPFAAVDAATEAAIVALLKEMSAAGKTILVVHHDLTTAATYFDHLLLLNLRTVAFGPTSSVFTPELLQKTYGGRLTLLSDAMRQAEQQAKGEVRL